MSTAHAEREAFTLLDEAIDATVRDRTRSLPVDAVLIVGVQTVEDDDDRIGYVEVYPRAGAQPASTRALVGEADRLLDQAIAGGDAGDDQP